MLITRENGSLRFVTQSDHARLAAQILALWRRDDMPGHPRRDALLWAVREHDNGWREADAAPFVDSAGRPLDFLALPEPRRLEVWRRGTERFASRRDWSSLLILEHALRLHAERGRDPLWAEFLEAAGSRRAEELEHLELEAADLEADYRLLALADRVSLLACGALGDLADADYRGTRSTDVVRLEPFPLTGSTTFELPLRRLPERAYDGATDLAGALAAASWEETAIRLVP